MKTLLIKDILLLKNYKKVMVFILVLMLAISFQNGLDFVSGYLLVFLGILSLSTISYDEANHTMLTLLSMPIQRKDYVKEKYLFAFFMMMAGFFIVMVLSLFKMELFQSAFYESLVVLSSGLCLLALALPFQLKYGQEKGRIVMLVIVFLFVFASYFLEDFFQSFFLYLDQMNPNVLAIRCLVISFALYLISMMISIFIFNKREF